MLSTLVVCLLVLGATAFRPPTSLTKKFATPLKEGQEPCCAPNYFTYSATAAIASENSGSGLKLEVIHVEGAYDAITEEYAATLFEDFFNKTTKHLRLIENYKKGEGYLIVKDGDSEDCYASKTSGQFPKECVPDNAVYLGGVTVGDHGLEAESWYYASEDQSTHFADTVEAGECVPVSSFSREFDLKTGSEVEIINTDVYNFNLGICERDDYFKPPKSCDPERVLSKPSEKMLKFQGRRRMGVFPL